MVLNPDLVNTVQENGRVLLVLVGPTGAGKTDMLLRLSDFLPVEAVAADSRTIYRWMDIATAKPSLSERARVPHHLIDVVDPDEEYSVALFQEQAFAAIDAIFSSGRQPVLVGGAGLYVRAVCDGVRIPPVPPHPELRTELEALAKVQGADVLSEKLRQVDPESASRIHPNNVRRIIRALEVYEATGTPFSVWQKPYPPRYRTRIVGLNLKFDVLAERLEHRIDTWLGVGLVDEVQGLLDRGYNRDLTSMSGLGYKQISQYLSGEVTFDAAVERYKIETKQYARRQLSWFRPDPRITWFDSQTVTAEHIVDALNRPASSPINQTHDGPSSCVDHDGSEGITGA